ncbi:tetrathionate reductase subunit TtrC [Providencia burhodogranariea]|uniref:Tetrathionate reductase subunit C n=1 Tax=Providencia burhodogranariea DSM 19968 TaxID=1141662 RepID=K8WQR0_9GAMM|nr:tetrathionate reductase subunit TtrC [Providencia burhodogranariea]EKT62296.1 tetrathionate reductase subunit C [Providencia burhodogranariea DSM 19968]
MNEQATYIAEIMAQPQEFFWLPWAVQYFFFIGIASCAVLYACWLNWQAKSGNDRLEMIAIFISITMGITGPLALTADLHQTARVWHFYAHPTLWSWMWWGSVLLPLFTTFSGLYFIALLVKLIWKKEFKATRWIALLSAVSAAGLLLYTGREASVLIARPIWFSWWIPVLMFLSAMQALPALINLGTRREPQYQHRLARFHVVTLLLLAVCFGLWLSGDTVSGVAVRHQLDVASPGWWMLMGICALWAVALVMALRNLKVTRSVPYITLSALVAMGLTWSLRWVFLMEVQAVPKYNIIANPYDYPLGTDGMMAIIGTFGLWIALTIMVREGVRWFARRVQHG